MNQNRYFIFTEPIPDSTSCLQNFSSLPQQNLKDKENSQLHQNIEMTFPEGIQTKEKNYLQNEGLSLSNPNFCSIDSLSNEEKQKFHKFQTIDNINECKDNDQNKRKESMKKVSLKKKSTIKCFYQKIHTQIIHQIQKEDGFLTQNQQQRKSNKRKKCRIRFKEGFEKDCQNFLKKKEQQEVDDLFRYINREMKLSQKRNEGNNFYQRIRKNAIKKIDYMSYNQKYYDNSEVRHLHSVVENCNKLIHKRDCKIDAKPLYHTLKHRPFTQYRDNFVTQYADRTKSMERIQQKKGHNKNKASIIKGILEQTEKQNTLSDSNKMENINKSQKRSSIKTQRFKKQTSILTNKMNNIMRSCSQQRLKMKQVKKGMKIFEFYCNKLEQGFCSQQNKLNNFLKWQEVDQ